MGGRRKKAQALDQADVQGPAGDVDQNQEEQKALIEAFLGTFRHFFGGFSPSVQKHL